MTELDPLQRAVLAATLFDGRIRQGPSPGRLGLRSAPPRQRSPGSTYLIKMSVVLTSVASWGDPKH